VTWRGKQTVDDLLHHVAHGFTEQARGGLTQALAQLVEFALETVDVVSQRSAAAIDQ
jgi:hypothetical protein